MGKPKDNRIKRLATSELADGKWEQQKQQQLASKIFLHNRFREKDTGLFGCDNPQFFSYSNA